MLICPLLGGVSFGHLLTVESSRFPHSELSFSPLLINAHLVERYFETMEIACPSSPFC